MPPRTIKMSIPKTEEYRALRDLYAAAAKGDGMFMIKIDANGDATFRCGDKTAVLSRKDPLYEVLSREWFGHKEH